VPAGIDCAAAARNLSGIESRLPFLEIEEHALRSEGKPLKACEISGELHR
jgi:hypothetical protein